MSRSVSDPTDPLAPAPWEDIPELLRAFEGCTLSKTRWTHAAHLTVVHHYLWHLSRDEATGRMCAGIKRYNLSQGNPNGYHETVTLAWVAIVWQLLTRRRQAGAAHDGEAESAREVATLLADPHSLLEFYTAERLMSDEARTRWMPPDRRAIE